MDISAIALIQLLALIKMLDLKNSRINKKCWVIAITTVVLVLHFVYERTRILEILNSMSESQNDELQLKVNLMLETRLYINFVTYSCFGLLVLNILLYKFWVKSKRWIIEPIIILVLSFATLFALHNYNMFEIRDSIELEKEKLMPTKPDT